MIVAVIPALNEAARIAGAVRALHAEGVRHILIFANGCSDDTAERAGEAGAHVLVRGRLPGGVGEARATGCAEALRRWPDARVLISTDADARVDRGCVAALDRALARADAAMGRLIHHPAELSALPCHVAKLRRLEERRDDLLAELGSLSVPRPHDPLPRHLHRAGGLMAFRPAAYLGVGGFRPMLCHEDRDIATRLSLHGYKTAHPRAASVTVSCRTAGRAPAGMAVALRAQSAGLDAQAIERLARQCRRLGRIVGLMRRSRAEASRDLAVLARRIERSDTWRAPVDTGIAIPDAHRAGFGGDHFRVAGAPGRN
jgi:GT2 family glycosyltransferase